MSAVPMAVRWESGQLILLDQTQLPHAEVLFVCETIESVFTAITSLKVRGAPAIGIAAAYGLLVGLDVTDDLMARLKSRVDYLASARPTAVNLAWALSRMLNCALTSTGLSGSQLVQRLEREAIAIHAEDRLACQAIGAAGAPDRYSVSQRSDPLQCRCPGSISARYRVGTDLCSGGTRGCGARLRG